MPFNALIVRARQVYEIIWRDLKENARFENGSPARTRTRDRLINSQLLYQLSYWGMALVKRAYGNCEPADGQ
jgi:hypothetical protein